MNQIAEPIAVAQTYPAITVYQPYAMLIAEGLETYEFRTRPAPKRLVGQRIAIHAAGRPVRRADVVGLMECLGRDDWRAATGFVDLGRAMELLEGVFNAPDSLPLAAVVCIATLLKPMRVGRTSNWGWPLTKIERLEPPVPARGAQGWWTWTRA